MEAPASSRVYRRTSAAAHLDGQVTYNTVMAEWLTGSSRQSMNYTIIDLCVQESCASKLIPVPQIPVPMVATARPSSPTMSAPARPSSQERPASRMSMSAKRVRHLARMTACASTMSGATDASALSSTQASTARVGTCPAIPHRAIMEARAYRKERPAMSAPVCQVISFYFIYLFLIHRKGQREEADSARTNLKHHHELSIKKINASFDPIASF